MIDQDHLITVKILEKANDFQQKFILGETDDSNILKDLLNYVTYLTESKFGFIGDVYHIEDKPYISARACLDKQANQPIIDTSPYELEFSKPDTLIGHTLHHGESLISNDPVKDAQAQNLTAGKFSFSNFLSYPIRHNQQIIGFIFLANCPDGFQHQHLELLAPLLNTCKVMLVSSENKSGSRGKSLEEPANALKSNNSAWEWNLKSQKRIIPEKFIHTQGLQFSDIPGSLRHFFSRFIHPEDQALVLAKFRDHLRDSQHLTIQCRFLSNLGEYRWHKVDVQTFKDKEGNLARVQGVVEDIHHFEKGQAESQRLKSQTKWLKEELNARTRTLRENLTESKKIRKQLKENQGHFYTAFKSRDTPTEKSFEAFKRLVEREQHSQLLEEKDQLTNRLTHLLVKMEANLLDTERLRKNMETRESLLQNALDTYDDVFIIFDADRRIKFINQEGLNFLGMKEEKVIGKRDEEFLPDEVTNSYLPTLKKAYQLRKEQSLEASFSTPEGIKEVLVRYIPQLDEKGDVLELMAITFDITDKNKNKRETLRLKEQYQYLFRNSPLPMWIYDLETLQFMDVNEAATQYYGWTKEEFLSMTTRDIRPHTELKRLLDTSEHKISKYSNSGIWTHLRKDGTSVEIEITSHEMVFEGRKARIVMANDVTERLKAERELLDSQTNLKATVDNGLVSLILLDQEGRIVLTDLLSEENALKFAGKVLKPGEYFHEFVPEELKSSFHKNFEKAQKGKKIRLERQVNYTSENTFWLEISYSPVINSEGTVTGVVYSSLDITDRRTVQNQLAESEANLKAIFDATSHSYFLLDKNYSIIKFNKLAASTVRVTHGKELNEGENMLDYSDPSLIENFKDAVERALSGEKITVERKVDHPIGERWYSVQYLPVANDAGRIYGVAFVAEDITISKKTEVALKKSYQDVKTIKNALYNSALITVTDQKGIITEVNEKFCEVSQYQAEEVIGKSHRIINSSYHTKEFFKQMWDTIQGGEIWRGDLRNQSKDGSYYWVDTFIHPIKDEQGKLSHYLSVRYLITDRKEAEQETQVYAHRLDDILENITDGFFTTDREWRFTKVNNVLEKTLKKSREELLGTVIWDAFPEAVYLKFFTEYEKTMNQGIAVHFEEYFQPLDTWFEAHAYPAEDGISVYFRDITPRKKSEAEIKKLSLVASKTDNTVIITNARREIEWVNEGFTKLTGYKLNEVIGRNPGRFLQGPESDQATVERIRHKLRNNESLTEELINYNKKGEKYWIKMDINPILNKKGVAKKFIAIQSNITERKQAELEKARLLEELIQKNKSLEEYAFITSHNLRAPVAHILGLTSLFNEEDIADPFNVTLVKQLSKASENLDSIIRDITELLAIRKDIVKVKEHVPIDEVVEVVIENLQDQINESFVDIRINLEAVSEIYMVKDFLYSMLLNMLSNAIKYRHPGRHSKIEIIASVNENQKCISVIDNGLGIDLEKYGNKIFSLYSRYHTHVEGKGMGLHLVKTLTDATGGFVKVESTVGEGSTFTICFPADDK